ncbi:FAD-dependent oxidoreductase, partial [bacterium]|nr:FAD-dependent oxidoreductase [bacterium]
KPRTAVIGAGPAGLACAWHLALAGHAVKVFEAGPEPGGVPANVIPRFRIDRGEIAADIARIKALGVEFAFGSPVDSLDALRAQGFSSFFVGIGADSAKDLSLAGSGVEVVDALAFLGKIGAEGPEAFAGKRRVVVAGGGNTACDAVRAATRIPGIESVSLSYRRTRREMPADLEELENAEAEALALKAGGKRAGDGGAAKAIYELSLPEEAKPGALVLRKMALGERDASGRRSPEPTAETFELPCDLLVAAIGEAPDRATLESFGIAFGPDRKPIADAATMATGAPGVYLGGDARRGPASIIAAEADGRAAARAIVAASGGEFPQADYRPPRIDYAKLARRGEIIKPLAFGEPGFAAREAERCLACDSACLRCVEVCPNRANTFIEAGGPFAQQAQILHLDRLCNECGNCGFFCPYEGEPYSGKITLFDGADDLAVSRNAGFAFIGKGATPALLARAEIGGPALELDYASWNGAASLPRLERLVALARAVFRDHRYLLEATP